MNSEEESWAVPESSEEELDDDTHKRLVHNILNLNYVQHVQKASRTEPTFNVSEYDLVKIGKNVHLADLASSLGSKSKQEKISRALKRVEHKSSTLVKPLHRPQVQCVRRSIAYQRSQIDLDKWNPIVTSMRAATHTVFPLKSESDVAISKDKNEDWGYQSEIRQRLSQLEKPVEIHMTPDDEDDVLPMTLEEMEEQRHEAAKLHNQEQYKIVKARRQNKIKSKKYHRIQCKEKLKNKVVGSEELAKARVEERMSLRHKSTGQWAKSKVSHAKHDQESRHALAEQLAIGRDLTTKRPMLQIDANDDDSDGRDANVPSRIRQSTADNPWLDNIVVSKEVEDFMSAYRAYSDQDKATPNTIFDISECNEEKSAVSVVELDCMKISEDSKKIQKFKNNLKLPTNKQRSNSGCTRKNQRSEFETLQLPKRNNVPIVDDELNEESDRMKISAASKAANLPFDRERSLSVAPAVGELNFDKSIIAEPIKSHIPDLLSCEENSETNQRNIIAEAFMDDEVVQEFRQDKENEIQRVKPNDADLSMPGWGDWGGNNIPVSSKKKQRFTIKLWDEVPRKDCNKGDVIVNENMNAQMRAHLISEVPFPFKNVKDYEANTRAPIGNTFIPETASRAIARTGIKTKMGTVIESMTTDVLMRRKK